MAMLGFNSIGRFALGQIGQGSIAAQTPTLAFCQPSVIRKAGLSAAVIATTFAGFVPPPQAQAAKAFTQFSQPQRKPIQQASWQFVAPPAIAQTAIFAQFSQPLTLRVNLPDEQPSALFEVLPPQAPPFTGFARFSDVLRPKSLLLGFGSFVFAPPVPDTHDLVFDVFRKKKNHRDPIDLEIERKAKLRADLKLAVYGPEVTYEPPAKAGVIPAVQPPNVEELAKAIMTARAAHEQAQRDAISQDDEDVIEMILRDL